ncbi:MAG: cellobiose phosphorylase [Agathobacter sp.]|nr:cellobiose phosphorylase [Agathobacter sp.]
MNKINFIDEKGTFTLKQPENYSYLYFPVAGEKGIKSAIAPNLGGDCKLGQNAFVLEPVSSENLHNNKSTRNFWCCFEEGKIWSAVGQSAEAEAYKFTKEQEESELTAGIMWHEIARSTKEYHISAKVTSFVPVEHNVEVMYVELTNTGDGDIEFAPVAAVPIYGRSADNIRDHRHVTSLLHRIRTTGNSVLVHPTLSFDERGHQKNTVTYFVSGVDEKGTAPVGFYPVTEDFIGEGGSFTRPRALIENHNPLKEGVQVAGKEAIGGIRFEKIKLEPNASVSYTIIIGATEDETDIEKALAALSTKDAVIKALEETKNYWQEQVNIYYHTGDKQFDNYMRWVTFQPFLRRIYGCSFLPYHDYGKGGRGWRDLWQDCLALLMMNPGNVRQMIIDNYGGVRVDGTNATIIGEKQGEFIADRNGITRVWMDHGVWPFLTTKLYIDQTGDIDILNQKVTYFKDGQVKRGTAVDTQWTPEYGNKQKDGKGNIYEGTILEHLLLQNLCAFYEVGEHNHIRLRGADWNDALDMAEERGESVAFTCAYAGNLQQLAKYIRILRRKNKMNNIELLSEMVGLLGNDPYVYDDIDKKQAVLNRYVNECQYQVSGARVALDSELVAASLDLKAEWIMRHVKETEWVTDGKDNGWFNSYYDNNGRQVEGTHENGVRMMLTGQVFALMSKTADKAQAESIVKAAKEYLYDAKVGGYKINTDFKEEKYDMGRMFGFAYGEKENGAVFSHMTVMFANSLYQNGFVREGYEALQTLADTSLNFDVSYMYPGIPEYFNASGRGMYSYLTGAASWYMLTVVTEAFGARGELGNFVVEPKLVKEQFDENGVAAIELIYAGKNIKVTYINSNKKDYGEYRITSAKVNEKACSQITDTKVTIDSDVIKSLGDGVNEIIVELN